MKLAECSVCCGAARAKAIIELLEQAERKSSYADMIELRHGQQGWANLVALGSARLLPFACHGGGAAQVQAPQQLAQQTLPVLLLLLRSLLLLISHV